MFGIGLPEMLLIMALALIVVGPDKLPDLARSLAKGLVELKKTAESLKKSFVDQDNPLHEIRPELEEAASSLRDNLADSPSTQRQSPDILTQIIQPADRAAEAYQELLKHTGEQVPAIQPDAAPPTDIPAVDVTAPLAPDPAKTRTESVESRQSEP